jgi:hypothetical protein
MAATPVEVLVGVSGLTLTLKLYPRGVDNIANGAGGDVMTEATNRLGCYRATVDEALNGTYEAYVFSGTSLIYVGLVTLVDNTAVHTVGEFAAAASDFASVAFTISNVGISDPAAVNLTTGYMLCLGTDGLPEVGVLIHAQMVSGPGTAGYAHDSGLITMTSDANGIAQHAGFVRGATYRFMRGTGAWPTTSHVAPDAATWELSELLGSE